MTTLWVKTSRHRIVIFFAVLAACIYFVPVQKFISLSRFQHWGTAISMLGVGYLFQTIWSWNVFSRWARIAHLSSALFWLIVGLTFFYNPWLDSRVAPATVWGAELRKYLLGGYLLLSLYLVSVYAKWFREEEKLRRGKISQSEKKEAQDGL